VYVWVREKGGGKERERERERERLLSSAAPRLIAYSASPFKQVILEVMKKIDARHKLTNHPSTTQLLNVSSKPCQRTNERST